MKQSADTTRLPRSVCVQYCAFMSQIFTVWSELPVARSDELGENLLTRIGAL